ncbi:unnamed protein product [Rodentolepis nana]|uniref:Intu_longin_2 domain-containing protein n=1 Tax=Rodentolepis nana TaxID=102285 RepID=A0A158QHW4_RODNA|nr:unnamed protein product [Rodentolepis nana]
MRSALVNQELIENGKTSFHVPREYVCGAVASMTNLIIVFPLHKTVFFQQLEGVRFSAAFARLRLEGLTHLFRGLLPPLLQRSTSASVMFGFQSQSQRFLNRNEATVKLSPYLKTIISATMAGSLEAALTPFERVQTLLQSSNNSLLYKNTSRALYSLLKSHGIHELYRGCTPIFLRNCIGNIFYFVGKDRLMESGQYQDLPSGQRHLTDFLIGGFLGSTIGVIIYPLNVAKCQMQSVVGTKFTSLRSSVLTLLNERQHVKIRRLYSGLPANVGRSLLSWGIITMVYEWLLTFIVLFVCLIKMTLPQVVAEFFIFQTGHESEEENVVLVKSAALPHGFETCESIIDDNIISQKLTLLCERFELIYGPMSPKSKDELARWRDNAMEFFDRELVMLDLSFHDIPDIINAIQRKFCSPKGLLRLDNIGTKIQLTCQYPNTDIAIFYDSHLAWSSLVPKNFLPVLRFIVSDLLSLPPDLDLATISPKAPHMGRFLTGLPNMENDLCPPQGPVPLLYRRLPDSTSQRIQVVVYRALRLSVCLFIDAKHNLDKEFFQSFDSAYGSALTDLSCTLDTDRNPNMMVSSDLVNLSISASESSSSKSVGQATPSNSSLRGFLMWEPELVSVKTNFFKQQCGGRSETILPFSTLLPIMHAARHDIISCFGNRWNECLFKLEPETWLYFRRLNKREVFLIFSGKKVDVSVITSESKRFGVENLAGLFRIC